MTTGNFDLSGAALIQAVIVRIADLGVGRQFQSFADCRMAWIKQDVSGQRTPRNKAT